MRGEMSRSREEKSLDLEFRPVEQHSPLSFHYQIKMAILDEIDSGRLEPGDRLPSEHRLCQMFGVSRIVVRQALTDLDYEGRIERRSGRGTYVAPKRAESLAQDLIGFHDEIIAQGKEVRNEVRELGIVPASASIARELGVAVGEDVILLDRLRYVDGKLWVASKSFLAHPRFRDLLQVDFSSASLYSTLREHHDVQIVRGKRLIEAALADRESAEALGVRPGRPLMVLRSTSFDQSDVPVEYFVSLYDGMRAQFSVVLERCGDSVTGVSTLAGDLGDGRSG